MLKCRNLRSVSQMAFNMASMHGFLGGLEIVRMRMTV